MVSDSRGFSFGSFKLSASSSIIHQVEHLREAGLALTAYFYFDFRDSKKQEATGLLTSIVTQLSAKSDACHNTLFSLYSNYDAGSLRPGDDALLSCLETMLKTEGRPIVYIIIDGVDECPNDSGVNSPREWVLDLMNKLVELHLPNVRICATSRPEADIRAVLASSASHTVSLPLYINPDRVILGPGTEKIRRKDRPALSVKCAHRTRGWIWRLIPLS